MGYDIAISKAWLEAENLAREKKYSVQFLADEYSIDFKERQVLSLSCNIPIKPYISILILHYLARKVKGLPPITGEWLSFKV